MSAPSLLETVRADPGVGMFRDALNASVTALLLDRDTDWGAARKNYDRALVAATRKVVLERLERIARGSPSSVCDGLDRYIRELQEEV